MTVISYEAESSIVEAHDHELRLPAAEHSRYVKVVDADGTIRLIPLKALHESEVAVLEDGELYQQTRQGLSDFVAGRGVSSDWLFADDE